MEKILSFGEYPQTAKASWVKVGGVQDCRGYYKGSDGCYYAKTDCGDCFKVEPIQWRAFPEKNGAVLLLCERVLDSHIFDAFYNDYEKSAVRAWLNGEFLSRAFTASEKGRILVTKVDNSPESTGDVPNYSACPNTDDKVFLISVKEATSVALGFDAAPFSCAARVRQPTDYAKERGAFSHWLLRSPDGGGYCSIVKKVDAGGCISVYRVKGGYDGYGIVPALRIRL